MPVGQMDWAWSIILSSTPSSVRAGVLLASARNRHMWEPPMLTPVPR